MVKKFEKYRSEINPESIKALKSLIGQKIFDIYAPEISVSFNPRTPIYTGSLKVPVISASQLSIPKDKQFVNVFMEWVTTEVEDHQEFSFKKEKSPSRIRYNPQKKGIGPVSTVEVNIGKLKKIEILQAQVLSEWEQEEPIREKGEQLVIFDAALNFFGTEGSFSFFSEYGSIGSELFLSSSIIEPFDRFNKPIKDWYRTKIEVRKTISSKIF